LLRQISGALDLAAKLFTPAIFQTGADGSRLRRKERRSSHFLDIGHGLNTVCHKFLTP
jgi:hypothetical protein